MPPIPTILGYYQRIPAEPKKKIEDTYLEGSVIKLELSKLIFFLKCPASGEFCVAVKQTKMKVFKELKKVYLSFTLYHKTKQNLKFLFFKSSELDTSM